MIPRKAVGILVLLASVYWGIFGPFGILNSIPLKESMMLSLVVNGTIAFWGTLLGYFLAVVNTSQPKPRILS